MAQGQSLRELGKEYEVARLLESFSPTESEIDELRLNLLQCSYSNIPVVFYYYSIYAKCEFDLVRHQGRPETWADGFDATRIATALNASDAYICDKQMYRRFQEIALETDDFRLPVLFSMSQAESFLDVLNAL